MIILDTHVWVWWVHGDSKLTTKQQNIIEANESGVIGISAISLWEIAKLVELKRLFLPCNIKEWFEQALNYPGVRVIDLTPEIVVESTQLPGVFHRDPSDQLIVATARIYNCILVSSDEKIIQYAHVTVV